MHCAINSPLAHHGGVDMPYPGQADEQSTDTGRREAYFLHSSQPNTVKMYKNLDYCIETRYLINFKLT